MKRQPFSPKLQVRKIQHEVDRSGSPAQGWGAVVIGSPFVAVGTFLVLVAMGVVHLDGQNAPPWVIAAVGLMFAMAGLIFVKHGIKGLLRNARAKRILHFSPNEYWRADYRWNKRGIGDNLPRLMKGYIMFPVVLEIFCVSFHFIAWKAWSDGGFGWLIPGAFCAIVDLVVVACLVRLLKLIVRWLKFGRARITFRRFPFFLGENLDVELACGRWIDANGEVTICLRYVQEAFERTRTTQKSRGSTSVVAYTSYEDVWTIEADKWNANRWAETTISIPLPDNAKYCTNLLSVPARYWDLNISIPRAGVDYDVSFLLPIYSRTKLELENDDDKG